MVALTSRTSVSALLPTFRRHSTPADLKSQSRVVHRWPQIVGARTQRAPTRGTAKRPGEEHAKPSDGARASAALSSSKNSQFSRGTWPLRRKGYGFVVMSYSAANSIAEVISNKIHRRLQPSCKGLQKSRRPATIPRDENLEANSRRRRKAQGGTEATTRSILELSAAALQSRWFSSLLRRQAEWLAKRIAIR